MSRGKYLSLEEARETGAFKQFCKEHPSEADRDRFLWATEAEDAIREILLGLEDKTGKRVDAVTIDTRNHAECRTEIMFR